MGKQDFGGLSDQMVTLREAVVFPHSRDNTCGVLDAEGQFCAFSRGVMGPRRAAAEPNLSSADEIRTLRGRYLYGGWLRAHFGHFLLESTARLWALSALSAPVDGVIFTPFRNGGLRMSRKRYGGFLDILTNGADLTVVRAPTRVEELVVPDPGFGHHARILGSPLYRTHSRERVAATVPAAGGEKLYVSRSALADNRGGVFGEELIEDVMKANGYAIFHPQQHSIREQLARYRAARQLVALDGSALHMAAYALEPGARVGMILRRHSNLLDGLAQQIALFAQAEVTQIDALQASWVDKDAKRVDFRSVGELDFAPLFDQLAQSGFIASPKQVPCPDVAAEVRATRRGEMRRVAVVR